MSKTEPAVPNAESPLTRELSDIVQTRPYDVEAWVNVLREVNHVKPDVGRKVYEELVKLYPTSGKFWKGYIEYETRLRNFDRVEKLFQRCLIKVLNIDLWKTYIAYVRDTKNTLPVFKEKMAQAYDFALEKMGLDLQSYPIWSEYVTFLKSVEAHGSYAENQKITAIRKVFQRGVINPMLNVEQFWKDYVAYEQGINPIIAEKMTQERAKEYMKARHVSKEMEVVTRGLNRNLPPVPPTGSFEEMRQVEIWKRLISWERSNPLKTDDQHMVTRRVMFLYEQCLLCMAHHAEMWLEASAFLHSTAVHFRERGDQTSAKAMLNEVVNLYEKAINGFMNKNPMVYAAYAEFEESRNEHEKCEKIYQRFIEIEDVDPTLMYVQYLRFARRAKGIKDARAVFKKAREDQRSKHQIYIAAAQTEYFCSREPTVALKVFELGLKKFGHVAEYVLAYLAHLSHLNEDNNTRVLFERVLSSGQLDQDAAVEVWNRFLEFECRVGDLSSIDKVQQRRREALLKLDKFRMKNAALLVDRFRFENLYPADDKELKSMGYIDTMIPAPQFLSLLPGVATGIKNKDALGKSEKEEDVFEPDVSMMVPFKPKIAWIPGEHSCEGGEFPVPPTLHNLCKMIPPPVAFSGPFVISDSLLDLFMGVNLEEFAPKSVSSGGGPEDGMKGERGGEDTVPIPSASDLDELTKHFDLAKSVHWVVEAPQFRRGGGFDERGRGSWRARKRPRGPTGWGQPMGKGGNRKGEDESDEEENGMPKPPSVDIYRERLARRLQKN